MSQYVIGWQLRQQNASSENIKKEEASAIMSDVTADLRWTHFQPSAQARSHHDCSTLTVGKTQALTVCGRWHLVRENAICIRHKPICLQRIGVSVCVCERVRICVPVSLMASECVQTRRKRQKEESLSGMAGRWAGTPSDKHTSLQAYLPD